MMGGAAFPTTKVVEEKFMDDYGYGRTRAVNRLFGGMSLRDYFAAKALQGLLGDDVNDSPTRFAESAYALADAMIAAREK